MNLVSKVFLLLFLSSFYTSASAEVSGIEFSSCSVFSESEEEKKTEEEEPDCE